LTSKLGRDARAVAAMCLDPAAFPYVLGRVPLHWDDDCIAFLYQAIIVPGAEITNLGAARGAAAATAQELAAEIAAIKAKPPPLPTMDPGLWKSMQDGMVKAAKERYAERGVPAEEAVGGGGVMDPLSPLLEALRKEFKAHMKVLERFFTLAYSNDKVSSSVAVSLAPWFVCNMLGYPTVTRRFAVQVGVRQRAQRRHQCPL
jgi:hypothetical protein